MKFKTPDNSELRKLFSEFEFSSLLAELGDDAGVSSPAIESHYETILTEADLERWVEQLKKSEVFALDLETTSLHPVQAVSSGYRYLVKQGWPATFRLLIDTWAFPNN